MSTIEVVSPGTLTTVQDWPGRMGYWEVGVPPSGPMDDRSFRIGNRIVGNPEGAPGLEVTLTGPRLRFASAAVVAVTGAPLAVELDGTPAEQWAPLHVPAGGVLRLGAIRRAGMRAYVLVGGGLRVDAEMGSAATFAHAGLGGGPLRRGDRLTLAGQERDAGPPPVVVTPTFTNRWRLRVVLGPHGAPDFLTRHGLDELLTASWTVHHHSDRTGVRLVGPAPEWSREDGGEAGLHPSNILDSAYGVGTVMLAGDMAVVVGPDGPSLGGFVALAQVIGEDMWRVGQLRAGDEVVLQAVEPARGAAVGPARRTVFEAPADGAGGPMTFRRAGERGLLVEFGEPVLDLRSRVRVHALRDALGREDLDGVLDITPGVRSLHVHRDPALLSERRLLDVLVRLEASLPAPESMSVVARTVHLPLAWRHSEAMLAVTRYATSVRADAPWCPDNIEFIRRINGLEDEAAVQQIVLDASYLVLGLGDVYMGAPVAVPVDPRHRLVTTKYNPARTWTPANAVGIGGAFLCVYGMEGPGGYQLVGRTVPVWHQPDDPPWRLRHFDQLRFHAVGEEELEDLRAESHAGRWAPRLEPVAFSLAEHDRFCAANAADIASFRARREDAFAAERGAWGMAAAVAEEATWS
jgi:urea carboxylase